MSLLDQLRAMEEQERERVKQLAAHVFGTKEGMELLGLLTVLAPWHEQSPRDTDFVRGNKEITGLLWALAQPGKAPLVI